MSFYNHNSPARSRIVNPWLSLLPALFLAANASFALDTGDIVVASTRGEVHFLVNGAERALRAGSVLELPATVRTGRNGGVELRQGATSLSVGPDTLLEFPALAQKGGPIDRVLQPRGNVFYDIGKRAGRKLRVETPYLVGVVKGTQFNVAAQDNATTISLFEGLLEVRAANDSDVVDLRAGEIASRDRSASEISVFKMDGKAPAAPKPAAGTGTGNGAPAPSPPRAPQNVEGVERSANRDGAERTLIEPSATLQAEVGLPAGDSGASVDMISPPVANDIPSVDIVGSTPAVNVDVVFETPAVTADANVDLVGAAAGTGASVDVIVETPVVSADTSVDLVGTPAGDGATVDVAVETPVGSVNLDVGAGANVDLTSTPAVTVDAGVDLGIDTDDAKGNNGNAYGIGNGNGFGKGNDNGNGNGNGVIDTAVEVTAEVVEDTESILKNLLKKPGKK